MISKRSTQKVRPTQMEEFLRQKSSAYPDGGDFSRSVKEKIAVLTTAMRQIGGGTPGGAEVLAIIRRLLYDEWVAGSLKEPIARIKVDEKNCFGMIEWQAVREAAARFLPSTRQQHGNIDTVEQEGFPPMPKDRGAEQGDVDGPLECSLALGMVAAETRRRVAAQQASGSRPWIGVDDPSDVQRLQAEHAVRLQETANFQLGGPADGPRHVPQKNGGLADLWYTDEGDILCHPILVPTYLQEFDVADAKVWSLT